MGIILGFLLVLAGIKLYTAYYNRKCKSKVCLVGKTAIVTGANTGIGFETAKEFACRGARVIIACRDEAKANQARDEIIKVSENKNVVVRLVDFASLKSVRAFAKSILATEERLDILINNAGVASAKDKLNEDGLQLGMQVNYFGPVLLTLLLLDLLKKSSPSRIVNVSSVMAKYANLTPENLNKYPGPYKIYNNSKLGNILFTQHLSKLLKVSGVSVFSVHPGAIKTDIFRKFTGIRKAALNVVMTLYFKNASEGAQTTLHAALEQGIEPLTGSHLEDCRIVKPYAVARDVALERAIWDKTMELLNCVDEAQKLTI